MAFFFDTQLSSKREKEESDDWLAVSSPALNMGAPQIFASHINFASQKRAFETSIFLPRLVPVYLWGPFKKSLPCSQPPPP